MLLHIFTDWLVLGSNLTNSPSWRFSNLLWDCVISVLVCVATTPPIPPTPHPPTKFLFQEVVVSCFVRCLSQVLQVLWCCNNSLSSLLFSVAPRQPKWCFESGQTAINLWGSPRKPGTLVDCSIPPCPSQRRSFKVGFPSQA